jgi:hypothetical protein
MTKRSGTWSETSGEDVPPDEARAAWTLAARPVLLAAAQKYGEFVTYKALAEATQRDADITTTQRADTWIGDVLGAIGKECADKGEPLLCAFAVKTDETVGVPYVNAVIAAYGITPEDPDAHAAEERLKAHEFFGAEMPPGGGRPRLPPKLGRRRARERAAVPRVVRPMCPNCFVELPVNGPCGLCADD